LKEREREKKDMEERLKNLKRSQCLSFFFFYFTQPHLFLSLERKDMLVSSKGSNANEGGDDFDVAVEDAISDRPSKRNKSSSLSQKSRMPRHARDKKFGFGGAGRRSKQNTKESTDNFSFGGRGKKGSGGGGGGGGGGRGGKKQRPGKARRMTAKNK
jgi:rRNA-processing protein EBP2